MKLLILVAIIAAVAPSPVEQNQKQLAKQWPWQVGKVYHYDVYSHTWANYEKGVEKGNTIKAQFIISVKAAGHLQVTVENPQYASVKTLDDDKFKPIPNMNQTFDIFVDYGHVVSIDFPASLSVVHENLIKSFISALQVDISTNNLINEYPTIFDSTAFQGLFKKMEYDLSGECETLYSLLPISAEWRKELLDVIPEEDPFEIIKTKNYGNCLKYINYNYGVPEGAVWKGIAKTNDEKQFIQHTSSARLLVGKEGTIYKSEVVNSVIMSPLVYGKQKAEVNAFISVYLKSVQKDDTATWNKPKELRTVKSVLFTVDNSWRLFTYGSDQNIAKAQKILQQISPLLQNPDHLQKGDFLMQFNMLIYLLFSMNSQQLAKLTSSIEIAKASKNVAKNSMWIVYRDALAQTGTATAFEEIKSWVLTNKIKGEEAAQVITAIGAVLPPTKAVVTNFFNFATSDLVQSQKALNNSALLALTKLLRFSKEDEFIKLKVIPHFVTELKKAIENGESSKAQVYIVALGNLAHPSILGAFAPYLEGRVPVTKYLRTQMVTSLKPLANLKDKYVRSVLYSILRNTAEPYEVRVAAALNIFLAVPTPEMMQVMAHMTNLDPSTQVRAVLTNSITFAAELKDPRFADLAKTAQSMLSIISKEKFGYSYSTDSLMDGYTGDDDFSFFKELSYIGSDNIILPKYHRSALRFKGTGFGDERQVTLSISDLQILLDNLAQAVFEPSKVKPTFKFSAKKIIEMLSIKRDPREPLEGALFIENFNQQKLYTFNENDFYTYISNIINTAEHITDGINVHFTKILRQNRINIDFPLASGMAFTYQYSEPMIINAQAETKLVLDEVTTKKKVYLENKFNVTYARNIVGTVGFMDTIGEVLVGAGVINKLQVYIPGKIKTTFTMGGELIIQVEPLQTDNDINLVHMSVIPFTGTQEKDSITYNLDKIEGTQKDLVTTDLKFGYLTGMYYHLYGKSYSSDVKNLEKVFDADFLTNLGNFLYMKDIALTEYNFKYLKTSPTKLVTLSFFFDTLYNQKNSGEMGPATLTEHTGPNNLLRRAEIIKKVSTGIEAAEVSLIDMSAIFDGKKKVEYVFTAAYAESFVDPKIQTAFISHLEGSEQISGVFKLNTEGAKIVPLNFKQALENEIKVTYEADMKLGNKMDVQLQGYGERTAEYTELLKSHPMGKSCLQDVSNHNLYQKDCHKMIIMAHAPDYFKTTVTYKGEDSTYWKILDVVYKFLKDEYSWEEELNPFINIGDNKLEIESKSFYFDNYENYNFTTKYGLLSLNNVESTWYDPYATAIYGPIDSWDRSSNWFTDYQYLPYCAVDDNKVRTFSGRSYNYKLSSSWHVVMVDESNDYGKFDDLVILARRPSDNEAVVYVSYKAVTGKFIELEIKPNHVDVKTDGVKMCEGALTMYWDDADEDLAGPLLEYYNLAEGVQVFNIYNREIRLVYDHHRLIIFTDEHRNTTRGICGHNSGQTNDDYLSPFGLVNLPQYYGASFSLEGEFSDPKTVELKKEAKQKAYQPVTRFTVYNTEWTSFSDHSQTHK